MQPEVTEESHHRLLGVQIGHICRSPIRPRLSHQNATGGLAAPFRTRWR